MKTSGSAASLRSTAWPSGFERSRARLRLLWDCSIHSKLGYAVRQTAIGIAGAGRFDLDDVGAEIRQHGGGRGGRDKACAVQHLEAFKNTFFHGGAAPVTFVGLFELSGW